MPLGNSGGATTAELGEFGASLCAEARKRLGDGVTLPPMPELPAAKPKGERKASPAPKKRAAKPTSDVVVPKASADAPIPWTPTAAAQAVKADAGKAYHDTIMNGVIAMLKVAGFDVIDLVKHALGGK